MVRLLAEGGHRVTVLHRGRRPLARPSGAVDEVIGDRAHLADLAADCDVVVDMICADEPAARGLASAFAGRAQRFVIVSSADVYRALDVLHGRDGGAPQPTPIRESGALRSSHYPYRGIPIAVFDWVTDDYDKILAEDALCASAGAAAVTVLRLPMVYGPGDPLDRFRPYLAQMDAGPIVSLDPGAADWVGCWGYVENVAAAIALACTDARAAGQTYNVADPDPIPLSGLVAALGRVKGWTGSIVESTTPTGPPFRYEQSWFLDSTRIRTELGYRELVPVDEALRRTAAPPPGVRWRLMGDFVWYAYGDQDESR